MQVDGHNMCRLLQEHVVTCPKQSQYVSTLLSAWQENSMLEHHPMIIQNLKFISLFTLMLNTYVLYVP